ncbi:hypothetical protein CAEBREN_29245 [Caenorhabditis brenneri]|uniref:Uncharacterized protein n=1 Tax=Caenorhabditis brenneri TaxID=135651 RepID=G0NP14_CAEBE|nr:hypothetical protein CAEBREN_29245 [Caenorhabditis brenneri]
MSSSEDAVEAILKAQSSAWNTYPKLIQRAALPPISPKTTPSMLIKNESIGSSSQFLFYKSFHRKVYLLCYSYLRFSSEQSRPSTSTTSRPPTTKIGFPALPKLPTTLQKPLEPVSEKPQTPLYPIPRTNISYVLNLNDIDENEVLRPESVASTVIDSDREIERKLLRIPETFSEFRELSVDLDQVSIEDIEKMLQNTKAHDHHSNGLVSMSSLLNSIRIIHPSDTWQHLLDWLIATSIMEDKETEPASTSSNVIFFIDYQLFFEVLQNDKQSREVL